MATTTRVRAGANPTIRVNSDASQYLEPVPLRPFFPDTRELQQALLTHGSIRGIITTQEQDIIVQMIRLAAERFAAQEIDTDLAKNVGTYVQEIASSALKGRNTTGVPMDQLSKNLQQALTDCAKARIVALDRQAQESRERLNSGASFTAAQESRERRSSGVSFTPAAQPPLTVYFPEYMVLERTLSAHPLVMAIKDSKERKIIGRMIVLVAQGFGGKTVCSDDLVHFQTTMDSIITEKLPKEGFSTVGMDVNKISNTLKEAFIACMQERRVAMSKDSHFPGTHDLNAMLSKQAEGIRDPQEKSAMTSMISLASIRLGRASADKEKIEAEVNHIVDQLKSSLKNLSKKQWAKLSTLLQQALMSCKSAMGESDSSC